MGPPRTNHHVPPTAHRAHRLNSPTHQPHPPTHRPGSKVKTTTTISPVILHNGTVEEAGEGRYTVVFEDGTSRKNVRRRQLRLVKLCKPKKPGSERARVARNAILGRDATGDEDEDEDVDVDNMKDPFMQVRYPFIR